MLDIYFVFNRATINMRPHATTCYLLVFCGRILETTRQRRLTTSTSTKKMLLDIVKLEDCWRRKKGLTSFLSTSKK